MEKLKENSKKFKNIKKEWLSFSAKSEKELFDFIHHLIADYGHDYGTCVHATAAAMKAVLDYFAYVEGMTGFQVSCLMWQVIQHAFGRKDKIGMRLQSYENLLYPQYIHDFSTVELDSKQAQTLCDMAQHNLRTMTHAHPDVIEHWKKIVDRKLPDCVVVVENGECEVRWNAWTS